MSKNATIIKIIIIKIGIVVFLPPPPRSLSCAVESSSVDLIEIAILPFLGLSEPVEDTTAMLDCSDYVLGGYQLSSFL